ncbi:sirohydrochlorin chelatase [Gracilibacillus sp. YIM 98692]|uniref:sirohydrochlorin chelatase n=1 Tax=Gracilibacillus sp. YIM 98692 TaxID=2663532 RepID=UPI0013D4333A|nr:sirohydrochlorin chelatase [Gracilibacillus sp. YIM 98692]
MRSVIYICHGSRLPEAKEEAYQLISKVKRVVEEPIQEMCFLELQDPTLSKTVENVISQGAEQVMIVPVLLLTAGHAKHDIPEMIEKERWKYPEVSFHYGRPIEVEPKMIEVLVDHIRRATTSHVEDYDILLVGRGSSDQQAVSDTETILQMLGDYFPAQTIEKCFLAASKPKFEELLSEKVIHQEKSVMIVPYLLFTGLLITGIKQYVEHFSLKPDQQIIQAEYLGQHDHVVKILKERVIEVRKEADVVCNNGLRKWQEEKRVLKI